ncbi:MAG: thioredoxin [Nanoarchaeota archaeon]
MSDGIIELNSESFDGATVKGKWIIDFWAEWCGPCVMMKPVFEAVAKEFKGKVNFAKIDIDSNQDIAERFSVMSIPTILLIENGEVVDSSVGYVSKDALNKKISETFS